MFYLIATLMVVLALAFVLVPILRNKSGKAAMALQDVSTDAANLEAFRLQRREIETEFGRGLMSETARDEAMDELSRRLAGEVNVIEKNEGEQPVSGKNAAKPAWFLGVVISVFVIVGATLGYARWGAHNAHDSVGTLAASVAGNEGESGQQGQADHSTAMSDPQVLAMVEKLAKKMEENPNDPRGWVLLARSQNALGQFAAAAKAFGRALSLTPNDAQLLADYADSLVMAQEGNFKGKPSELIAQALKADPNNMKALALAGTAEMRAENKPAAIKHWEKLKSLVPKDSDDYVQVVAIIDEIKTGKPAFPKEVAPSSANAESGSAGRNAAATTPAPPAAVATTLAGKIVTGQINIAPELKAKLTKNDTLFVFARAVNGPKMPLAALRLPVPSSWPFAFQLNDAMAMAPGMSLSSFAEVTIEARISKAGNAQLQPGDMLGSSETIKPSAANVSVTITKVVP